MAGKRRAEASAPPSRGAARGVALRAEATRRQTRSMPRNFSSSATHPDLPPVVRQMLAETGVTSTRQMTSEAPERPLKRPRTGRRPAAAAAHYTPKTEQISSSKSGGMSLRIEAEPEVEGDEDDVVFEDVEIPKPTVQNAYLSTGDEESEQEEDIQFEDIEIPMPAKDEEPPEEASGTLNLNLTAAQAALTPSKRNRKQPISKAEKERRIEVHRMHLLCLLAHVEKRNHWCNDPIVHGALRSVLEPKTIQLLNPRPDLAQFGRTESIKTGLLGVRYTWKEIYQVTEVGLRTALWVEDNADLQEYELPPNVDNCLDKADFRRAAQSLRGSRDVGAQLCCALLRAVGVEARLVCSLQPLSFLTGGPTLPKFHRTKTPVRSIPSSIGTEPSQATSSPSRPSRPSPRARLGHPHAAAYRVPDTSPLKPKTSPRRSPAELIKESPFPVYWVEVLDVGQQKWQPVDVLVTGTHFRPTKLEPPASDRRNTLSYVVAFEEDGSAKDVTRRYAKAYNSKTRRMRIDGPAVPPSMEGAKWWRKALRRYRHRGLASTLDQIENVELNAAEAREPMPKNVVDFKDHPIYALERHLRRHEVLIPEAKVVGTVSAGNKGPLEKIYRRKDVRIARSADKWYRMGREINVEAEPMKVLRKRKQPRSKRRGLDESVESSSDEDPVLGIDPAKGTPIFTFDQTHLYLPPPVINGHIPKNRFGNLDVYVPSMVPAGGTHIRHPRAGHAAHILGVDYAPALMGFDWKGRKGTAVYNGVVVPEETADGVWAVLQGLEDIEAQMEEEKRRRRALLTWRNWLRTLKIRRRLFEGDEYWGDTILEEGYEVPEENEDEDYDAEEKAMEDDGGGVVLDDDENEDGGFEPGGFEPGGFEREDYGPGGFEPGGFDPRDAGSVEFEPGGFEPGGFEPGGFEPGGFEPGGFEPGGFEPGGFEPGGFEPGGFEPGGFEPGGFEPGGFEPEGLVDDAGIDAGERFRDRELHHPPFASRITKPTEKDQVDRGSDVDTIEGGGFLQEATDVIMTDELEQPPKPHTGDSDFKEEPTKDAAIPPISSAISVDDEKDSPGAASQPAIDPDAGADAGAGAGADATARAKFGSPQPEVNGGGSRAQRGEEDDEFADAPSDTTEEFYMDEDGALLD